MCKYVCHFLFAFSQIFKFVLRLFSLCCERQLLPDECYFCNLTYLYVEISPHLNSYTFVISLSEAPCWRSAVFHLLLFEVLFLVILTFLFICFMSYVVVHLYVIVIIVGTYALERHLQPIRVLNMKFMLMFRFNYYEFPLLKLNQLNDWQQAKQKYNIWLGIGNYSCKLKV